MHPTLQVIAWTLAALSAVGAFVWIIFLTRMSILAGRATSVREGLDRPAPRGGWPTLSIIVPAHDEEGHIDDCARLLREQEYERLELIFVLDRCRDRTAELLAKHASADARIVVIDNDACPDDWAGKCHAAHLGSQRATGDWLLFTDADTRFDPRLSRAAVALALERDAGLLSLWSTLTYEHRFERVAQLAAGIMLMILFPIGRTSRDRPPRPFANGQFLLFRRDWYERIGGHAAVKDDLLEDIAAAKRVHRQGGRNEVVVADGMLTCSMYTTRAAFEAGWKRIFIEACGRKPKRMRRWGRRVITFAVAMPLVQLGTLAAAVAVASSGHAIAALVMVVVVLAGWAAQYSALWRLYTMAHAPRRTIPLFPLGCLVVARILLAGARDLKQGRPVVWGRRQYVLEARF